MLVILVAVAEPLSGNLKVCLLVGREKFWKADLNVTVDPGLQFISGRSTIVSAFHQAAFQCYRRDLSNSPRLRTIDSEEALVPFTLSDDLTLSDQTMESFVAFLRL